MCLKNNSFAKKVPSLLSRENVVNHAVCLHFQWSIYVWAWKRSKRVHGKVLQLELQPLWTCGLPLHEAKGISQAAFSAVKCHYLGHMPQLKKLPGATPSPWRRGVPPVTQSCRPLWHHARIALLHLCMWGGLCSLPLAVYFSMALNMGRVQSDVNWIRDYSSCYQGTNIHPEWLQIHLDENINFFLMWKMAHESLNTTQHLTGMPPLETW